MENKGLEDHRYWCEKHDDYRVKGKMTWFVHRDEVIDQTAQISFEFSRSVVVPTHPSQKPKLMFRSKLMACDLDEAPDYMWKNPDGELIVDTGGCGC